MCGCWNSNRVRPGAGGRESTAQARRRAEAFKESGVRSQIDLHTELRRSACGQREER
jgi:hypothetical protein